MTDEWQRISVTGTPSDTSAHTFDIINHVSSAPATEFLIAFPQLEERSSVTSFTPGIRNNI